MNKEEILKDITRHFGIDNEPQEENAMFILPDGRFMYTDLSPEIEDEEEYGDFDDSLISQHNNVDEYIIYKGYAKESNKKPSDETLFQSMFNAIRFQIFDEDVSYLALSTNPPTSSQYDSILKVLDLAENWVGSIDICGSSPSSRGIRYSFDDYTPDDVLKRIKRYYASGILYEDVNVEMSGEFDSEGNELTKAQAEFFKNSKVRDGGKLLVVYHGSANKFNVFDKSKIRSGVTLYANNGDGFYFTTSKYEANKYGKDAELYSVYLNIEKPFDFRTGISDNKNLKILNDFATKQGIEPRTNWSSFVDADLRTGEILSHLVGSGEGFTEYLQSLGYDGVMYRTYNYHYDKKLNNSSFYTTIIAFEPNQIKSITNLNPTDKDNINESYMRLDEATKNQLIDKTKKSDKYKDQSKGKNRYERRLKSRIANSVAQYNRIDMDALFKRDILTLGVDVHGETNDYVVTVRFIGLLKEVQREVKSNNNKLEFKLIVKAMSRVFNSSDISLHCTCKDFQYRQSYNASKQNYGTQYEPRPSNITNPNDTKGGGCKHCMLVLANLDWIMKVSSVINNYIKYCQEHMEYNYATYIFPKVYGMPYKDALQMSMFDNGGYLPSDQKTIGDVATRNISDKNAKGQFISGNKFRFNKKDTNAPEEENPEQLKIDFDNIEKEVQP